MSFSPQPTDRSHRHTNRLSTEKSPYLLQHAHNPVDWHPWGEEAFAKARAENKMIFLSVGYSTCHWCHVMERESFEHESVARLMNEHFINVKVDREERPDVDAVYMTYVQAATGQGGWPMSVWLTPDLHPVVGGTYFPPVDKYGRLGFPTVLQRIAEMWQGDPEKVRAQGAAMVDALRQAGPELGDGRSAPPPRATELSPEIWSRAYTHFERVFDSEEGGFGNAPKFPRPSQLAYLLRFHAADPASTRGKHALEMTLFTLRKMAAGGMHDHLGGGFHRYSVDEFWHVPHFEKMLYDQGQLAVAYIEAYQATRDVMFADVARDILHYVHRDMTSPEGGFYSAEDADSLIEAGQPTKAEGAFYVWTEAELKQLLHAEREAEIFSAFYGAERGGNAPDGADPHGEFLNKNILIRRMGEGEAGRRFNLTTVQIEKLLGGARAKLLAARALRPRPHLDDKIITAWNGLMISGFARAAQALGAPEYTASAIRAAEFIHQQLFDAATGELLRSYREGAGSTPGFADDYAFLIQGLLDLYEAGFEVRWLQWAEKLQETMDRLFWDAERGGYFSVSGRDPSILLRLRNDYDSAEPAPDSIAAMNLLRLAALLHRDEWRTQAERTLASASAQMERIPTAMPQALAAWDFSRTAPRQIVLAGKLNSPEMQALLEELRQGFDAHRVVLHLDGGEAQAWLAGKAEYLKDVLPLNGKPVAMVCQNFTCQLPVTEPEQLRALLLQR